MTFLNIQSYGQGEELVIINGWGWNCAIWQFILPELSKNYHIHLVNIKNYSDLMSISHTLINRLPDSAFWLGWSLGGLIALHTASYYPKHIKKLIFVASSPCFIEKTNWPGIKLADFNCLYSLFQSNPKKAAQRFFQLQLMSNQYRAKNLALFSDISNHDLSGLDLLKQSDLTENLIQLSCSCLAIFGQYDRLVPVEIAFLMRQRYSIHFEILTSEHLPFYTQPKEFLSIIKKFYARGINDS